MTPRFSRYPVRFMTPIDFISRWKDSGGAELANSQSFLKELCTLLEVPHPEPTQSDESQNSYVFEKAVEFNNGDGTTSAGRVDLYRRLTCPHGRYHFSC